MKILKKIVFLLIIIFLIIMLYGNIFNVFIKDILIGFGRWEIVIKIS